MKKGALLAVYLVIFLDMLGFGVMIPVIRDLTQWLVARSNLSWPKPEIYMGVLMAVYSGSQMLSAPILGRLSDRYGRKPVFLISALGNVISYIVWILAHDYWVFLFGRILSGITGGNIAIAQSILADHTTPAERPKAMGLLGACIGMGFVLGPFLGGVLINFGHFSLLGLTEVNQYWLIGATCFGLSLISLILILFNQFDNTSQASNYKQKEEGFSALAGAWRHGPGRRAYVTQLLSQISFVAFEVLFAWILQRQYHFDLKETFYFFGLQGVILALVQGGLYRRLEKRRSPEHWVRLGLWGSAIGMCLLPWIGYLHELPEQSIPWKLCLLVVVLFVLSLAYGFGGPSLSAYASIHAPKNEQGQTMGNMQAIAAFARFAAPVAATSLYAVWLPLPFLLGGFLCVLAWYAFSQAEK